jgi:hypothetical protein
VKLERILNRLISSGRNRKFLIRFYAHMRHSLKIFNYFVLVMAFFLFSMRPSITNASQISFLTNLSHPVSSHGLSPSSEVHLDSCRCSFLDNKKQNDVFVHSFLPSGKMTEFSWGIRENFFSSTSPRFSPSVPSRFLTLRI